jgi:peptide/nickel transport system permease protein
MIRFIAPRIGGALVTLFITVTFVFFLGAVVGDPVLLILGDGATPEAIGNMRAEFGYDRPIPEQYFSYLANLIQGDLGTSIRYGQSNLDLVLSRLPFTVTLALTALFIAVMIGIPLGLLAAWKENSIWDRASVSLSVFFQSIPSFWLGLMLILIFGVSLGWAPAGGTGSWMHLLLPAITLAAYPTARFARLMRSSMSEVLDEEYVAAARARGISEPAVVIRHGLRNAALPVVTLIGLQAAAMLSGAVTVEFVFAWPGLGLLALDAVSARDIPLVQAVVIFGVAAFVLINLTVDLIYGVIDPRIRTEQ